MISVSFLFGMDHCLQGRSITCRPCFLASHVSVCFACLVHATAEVDKMPPPTFVPDKKLAKKQLIFEVWGQFQMQQVNQ